MRKFTLLITIMIAYHSYSFAQMPSQDSSYALVFNDDFNDTILNTNNWQTNAPYGNLQYKLTCSSPQDTLWFLEYYTPGDNLTFTGNSVKLQVKREDYSGTYVDHYDATPGCDSTCLWWQCKNDTCYRADVDTATFKYTSARLWSKKKFKYGYFEIRVKLPDQPTPPATYQGISTNFWLYNADGNVAWSELDVYEINSNGNILTNNVHFKKNGSSIKFESPFIYQYSLSFNNSYKIFSINWTPEKMEFYMDGVLLRTNTQKCDSLISMPIYIDMNIDQNQFCERIDTANTVLPYEVEVDYIKVYQRKTDCNTAKTYCNNIATHDYKTYKSIGIDGSSCTDALNNKPNESYTATDYILLDQGFELGNNVAAKFELINCFLGQDYSNSRIANPPPYEIPSVSWFERLIH